MMGSKKAKRLNEAYREVFGGDNPFGNLILKDLFDHTSFILPGASADNPYECHYNAGARSTVTRVLVMGLGKVDSEDVAIEIMRHQLNEEIEE